MKAVRFIADIFLFTSLLTACCAVGLCMATERLIHAAPTGIFTYFHVFIFGSTLLVYNVPGIVKMLQQGKLSATLRFRDDYWRRLVFGTIGFVLVVFTINALPLKFLSFCALLGFLSFAYSLPILPFKSRKRIRDYGLLKITALATVWTVSTSVLPMFYWGVPITIYPFEVLLRFAFIFTLCIIFDLRDVRIDAVQHIRTLPNAIGLHNSYKLIDASVILFVILSVVQYLRYPVWERLAGAMVTAVVTRLVAVYLRRHSSERLYLLLGDGLMLVYAGLVFFLP